MLKEMHHKRRICLLLGGLALTAVLTGCQKAQPKQAETNAATQTNAQTENEKEKETLDMGGLENYFQDEYEPSAFLQKDVDSNTIQWICSAYAIYTGYNEKELGIVGGILEEDKDTYQRAVKEVLSDGWHITERESAIKVLNKLLTTGHRSEYQEFAKAMEENGLFKLSEEELESRLWKKEVKPYKYLDAYQAYKFHGMEALDGWDYCRALQVLGDCYVVGYISLEECLDQSLAVAKKLQSVYASWDEVCESYLYGFQYWKEDNPNSGVTDTTWRREAYEELKNMENGPFTIPYDIKLTENWKGMKIDEPEVVIDEAAEEMSEGIYHLADHENQKTIKFMMPEGYEHNDSSGESQQVFIKKEKESNGMRTLCYTLSSLEIRTGQDMEDYAAYSEALWESQGGKNFNLSDVQSKTINGMEVKYISTTWEKGGAPKQACWSWTELDGFLLDCILEEGAEKRNFEFSDIDILLEDIYGNVQK